MEPAKAPVPVIIISWLLLLGGLASLFLGAVGAYFLSGVSGALSFLLIANIVVDISYVVLSFGLRKMRRWAFNWFMAVNILAIATSLIAGRLGNIIMIAFALAIMIYIWTIRQKFV